MAAAKRKRRWWRWLLLSLGALVALILAVLLAVLWMPAVSRFAVAQGISRWDASMPGRVEWRSIDGSIAGGLKIDGLALFDGDDQPLVRVESVELELEVLPLFAGTAELERLELEGVEIWLDHNWGDLSDPDAPKPPPKPGYGPDLPVEIIGTLELDDGRVWRDDAEFVALGALTVDAWGQGREATAALTIADIELGMLAGSDGAPLQVDTLMLDARWDSPVASIEGLELSAPIAEVEHLSGTYDFAAQSGALLLAVDGHADAIADQFGVEPLRAADHARLDLRAEGGPGRLEALIDLSLGAAGQLRVHGKGVPAGPVAQRWAEVDVDGRLGPGILGPLQGPVMLDLRGTIHGRGDTGFVAGIAGRLDDLHSNERLDLEVEAAADHVDPLLGRASVGLHGAGLEFDANIEHPEPATLEGRASLRSEALERPLTLAASLLGIPELREARGALALEGRCFTREADELDSLRCPLKLELTRASGFDVALERAQLDAYFDPLTEPLTLAAALDVEDLRLGGVAGQDQEFVFDALELVASGSLERLRVDAAGFGTHERFALAGAIERSDERLAIGLERLELVSDRADAVTQVELRHPTRVTYVDQLVDIDTLSLALAGGRLDIDGRLDLDRDRGRSDLGLDIDSINLARLDPLIPMLSVAGDLNIRAAVRGSLRDPDAWALVQAKRLRVGDYRPGTLGLVAVLGHPEVPTQAAAPIVKPALAPLPIDDALEFDDDGLEGGLHLWAYSAGPMARRINLAAAIPLTLVDGPGLEPGATMAVRVAVERFNLTTLGGLMPDTPSWWRQRPPGTAAPPGDPKLIPEGRVDLDLAVAGTVEQPLASAMVRARELSIDRTELGSMLLRASLADNRIGIDFDAKPGFTQIELLARIPVDLDLVERRLDWTPETDGHLVSLDVRAFNLDALQATLGPKLPDLEATLGQAEVSGTLAVSLRGSGSVDAPELGLAVRGAGLRFRDRTLGQLGMLAGYTPGRVEAQVHLDGPLARRLDAVVVAPIELRFGEDQPLRLDPDAAIAAEVHVAELSFVDVERYLGPLPVAGELELELEAHGSLADLQVDLRTRIDEFALAGDPVGDIEVRAALDHGRGLLDAKLVRERAQILALAVEVPLQIDIPANPSDATLAWAPERTHRIYVRGRGIDDDLLTALIGRGLGPPPGTRLAGEPGRGTRIDVDIAGGGRLDDFRVDGQIDGRLPVDDELGLTLAATFHADEAEQRLEMSLDPNRGEGFDAALELAAAVPALVGGEQSIGDIGFSAKVAAPDFNLHCASGLLPAGLVDPTGTLRAEFSGRGTVASPKFSGDLVIDDAALTVLALRQRLTKIDIDLEFAEQRLELNGLTATAGRGSLRGHGHAALPQSSEIYAELDLQLDRFPLVRPGLPAMALDTEIGLELRRWADEIDIDVVLEDTEVTVAGVNEAPPKAIPTSPKVTFVSDVEAPGIEAREPPEPIEPIQPVAAAEDDQGRFALSLDLSDPLLIIGAAIDMAWVGALELVIEAGEVDVAGELEARRGRLRLLGNSFDLRRGTVTLPDDGSLDPFLDVEAVASTAEAEVTVTVRGRLSRPALEFSSTPPLSEYQILTLLVTGSTEIGGNDGEVSAKAASLLAAVSNPQLQAQLSRHLGIDRAEIGFGETVDQPILTVGKRITRNVYVETRYHHNAPEDQNTAEVGVEYGILPHVTAESYFGDASVAGFGLYWTRTFPALRWGARFQRNDESNNDD